MVSVSTQATISREPSDYRLSVHAGQQRVHRDIPKLAIPEAIIAGEVRDTHEREKKLFVAEYPGCDRPVGVVANVADGEIVTVMWRDGS